jgi:hypothetical protein
LLDAAPSQAIFYLQNALFAPDPRGYASFPPLLSVTSDPCRRRLRLIARANANAVRDRVSQPPVLAITVATHAIWHQMPRLDQITSTVFKVHQATERYQHAMSATDGMRRCRPSCPKTNAIRHCSQTCTESLRADNQFYASTLPISTAHRCPRQPIDHPRDQQGRGRA